MEKTEQLECLINYYTGGNKAKFAQMLSVKPQTISAWISRNTFDAEIIYAKCANVSAEWLLSGGEGEMVIPQQNADNQLVQELIRLRAENDLLRELAGLKKKSDVG